MTDHFFLLQAFIYGQWTLATLDLHMRGAQ